MHGGAGGASSPPWRGMTTTLYTSFWALQLYDLEVPVARWVGGRVGVLGVCGGLLQGCLLGGGNGLFAGVYMLARL